MLFCADDADDPTEFDNDIDDKEDDDDDDDEEGEEEEGGEEAADKDWLPWNSSERSRNAATAGVGAVEGGGGGTLGGDVLVIEQDDDEEEDDDKGDSVDCFPTSDGSSFEGGVSLDSMNDGVVVIVVRLDGAAIDDNEEEEVTNDGVGLERVSLLSNKDDDAATGVAVATALVKELVNNGFMLPSLANRGRG